VAGVYTFDVRVFQHMTIPASRQAWVFAAFVAGFAATAALFPLHAWLTDPGRVSPAAVSILLLALSIKMGAFGLVRFVLPILPDATRTFMPVVVSVGFVTMMYGALAAYAQTEWRRLITYLTISQMGVAVLGIFALTPNGLTGGILQLVNHGVAVAALLLVAGTVGATRTRDDDRASTDRPRAIAAGMGLPVVTLAIAALAFAGIPGGVISLPLVLQGLWPVSRVLAAAVAMGVLAGACALIWLIARDAMASRTFGREGARPGMAALALPILAIAIWIGVHPASVLQRLETSVARVVLRVSPAYAPDVADCLSGAPQPPPADSGLPAGMTLAAPCPTGGESPAPKPDPKR
jgi:NADH-quinone oxidoreductase subunit M